MSDKCERSRLKKGFDLFPARSGKKHPESVLSISLHLTFTGRQHLRVLESHPAETFLTDRFSALMRTFTKPIHFHLTARQRAVISLLFAHRVPPLLPLSRLFTKPVDVPSLPWIRTHNKRVLRCSAALNLKYKNREHGGKYTSEQVNHILGHLTRVSNRNASHLCVCLH